MMHLTEAAQITQGHLRGQDHLFHGVSIDSREITKGNLFVAIVGKRQNGHHFTKEAIERGAVAVMVSQRQTLDTNLIKVTDTTVALGQLGASWRQQFDIPVIAITGSNGKTTVTRMCAAILSCDADCVSPQGSFNNQWGVPLTLLELHHNHQYAVLELGMNHAGELSALTQMVRPTIALINNVSCAHLENFNDVTAIAHCKAEVFEGLTEKGVAVINADDHFAPVWQRQLSQKNQIKKRRFGLRAEAEVSAENLQLNVHNSHFDLCIDDTKIPIELPLAGHHNIVNALAAATVADAAGASSTAIKRGLESLQPVAGRLQYKEGINQCLVIDDSYNANPASLEAALKVLNQHPGKRIAILGTMAELGSDSLRLHRQIGHIAAELSIEMMLVLGQKDPGYGAGFGSTTKLYSRLDDLIDAVRKLVDLHCVILVKGSRMAKMERVVDALVKSDQTLAVGGGAC